MQLILTLILIVSSVSLAFAKDDIQAPKWLLLGDDKDLKQTFEEAKQVAVIVITSTALEDIRPPLVKVVHHATVISSHKGNLWMGEKIEIAFMSDSLPMDAEKRKAFIKQANDSMNGELRTVFLYQDKASQVRLAHHRKNKTPRFNAEFLDLPVYSDNMHKFLCKITEEQKRANKSK